MSNSHVVVGLVTCALLLSVCRGCSLLQNQPFKPDEESLVARVNGGEVKPDEVTQCLRASLNKGLYDVAEAVSSLGQSTNQANHAVYDEQVKRLTQFSRQLITGITTIAPIMKWAQNNETVLVAFKLSHRWDSPPCTTTKHQSFNFENNTIDYVNDCVVSRQKIHFKVKLDLWQQVDRQGLEIKRDGVGTYLMTIRKKSPALWLYLDKSKTRHQTWGDIAERPEYFEHMNAYNRMLDSELAIERARSAKSAKWLTVATLLLVIYML